MKGTDMSQLTNPPESPAPVTFDLGKLAAELVTNEEDRVCNRCGADYSPQDERDDHSAFCDSCAQQFMGDDAPKLVALLTAANALAEQQRERAEVVRRELETKLKVEGERNLAYLMRLDTENKPLRRKMHSQRTELNRLNRTLAAERKAILGYQLRLASLLGITTPSLGPIASPTWDALLLAVDELEQTNARRWTGEKELSAVRALLVAERAKREHLVEQVESLNKDREELEMLRRELYLRDHSRSPAAPAPAEGGKPVAENNPWYGVAYDLLHGLSNWEPMNSDDVRDVSKALAMAEAEGAKVRLELADLRNDVLDIAEGRPTRFRTHEGKLAKEIVASMRAERAALVEELAILRELEQAVLRGNPSRYEVFLDRLDALRAQPSPTSEGKDSESSQVPGSLPRVGDAMHGVAPSRGESGHLSPDPLHPDGRCTCGGEGNCAWCKSHCPSCGSSEETWTIAPVMPWFTPARLDGETGPKCGFCPKCHATDPAVRRYSCPNDWHREPAPVAEVEISGDAPPAVQRVMADAYRKLAEAEQAAHTCINTASLGFGGVPPVCKACLADPAKFTPQSVLDKHNKQAAGEAKGCPHSERGGEHEWYLARSPSFGGFIHCRACGKMKVRPGNKGCAVCVGPIELSRLDLDVCAKCDDSEPSPPTPTPGGHGEVEGLSDGLLITVHITRYSNAPAPVPGSILVHGDELARGGK